MMTAHKQLGPFEYTRAGAIYCLRFGRLAVLGVGRKFSFRLMP